MEKITEKEAARLYREDRPKWLEWKAAQAKEAARLLEIARTRTNAPVGG